MKFVEIRTLLMVAAAFSVFSCAGIALAVTGSESPSGTASQRPGWLNAQERGGQIGAVQAEQARQFTILERPRRASDALPDGASRMLSETELTGKNTALARGFRATHGTGWVIPGNETVCLAAPDSLDGYGVSCAPTRDAVKNGLALVSVNPQTPNVREFVMLVPANSEVTARLNDASVASIPVNADGMVVKDMVGVTTVEVRTPTGSRLYEVPASPPKSPTLKGCPNGQVVAHRESCPAP